jgi:hypothetical protein
MNDLQIKAVIDKLGETFDLLWRLRCSACMHRDIGQLKTVDELDKIISEAMIKACECRA